MIDYETLTIAAGNHRRCNQGTAHNQFGPEQPEQHNHKHRQSVGLELKRRPATAAASGGGKPERRHAASRLKRKRPTRSGPIQVKSAPAQPAVLFRPERRPAAAPATGGHLSSTAAATATATAAAIFTSWRQQENRFRLINIS